MQCDWRHVATRTDGDIWCCVTCGRSVIKHRPLGQPPMKRECSGEFGRFENVTSRELHQALAAACADAWSDGESAANRYIEEARP